MLMLCRLRMGLLYRCEGISTRGETGHRPSSVSTRRETKIRRYQRSQRWVSMVREEDREHMVQIRKHVETSTKEETKGLERGWR